MRILLAVQGTGNGHLSRAREIIPHLQQYGDLHIAVSGTQADVQLGFPIMFRFHGLSFIFGKRGGVDKWLTYKTLDLRQLYHDIRYFPLDDYDLIINDFEPVTAWACKLRQKQCIALSHQSSFLSKLTPRPAGLSFPSELILTQYAPATAAIGFHFKAYDSFIHTPVIRSEIRAFGPVNNGHYTVYLPAYADSFLLPWLQKLPHVNWEVFSKHTHTEKRHGNVHIRPIENLAYNKSVIGCEGLLTGGGFEGPAEALFLGKKILAIPMTGQWEQQCNVEAMRLMGIPVIPVIGTGFDEILKNWVYNQAPLKVDFPDQTAEIVSKLILKYGKNA